MNKSVLLRDVSYNVDYRDVYSQKPKNYNGSCEKIEKNALYEKYNVKPNNNNSTIYNENVESIPSAKDYVKKKTYRVKLRILSASFLLTVCVGLFAVFIDSVGGDCLNKIADKFTVKLSPVVMRKVNIIED